MRNLLLSTVAVVALVTAAKADPVTWGFNSPLGGLGPSHIYSDGIAGDPSITATAYGPGNPQLFGKDKGPGEQGLGLTNDLTGDNEITPGSLIDFDISQLAGKTGLRLSFQAGSTQGNETWHVYGSNTPGLFGTSIAIGHTDDLVADLGVDIVGAFSHLQVTADAANVLVQEIDGSVSRIPEPMTLLLLGVALVVAGVFRKGKARPGVPATQ